MTAVSHDHAMTTQQLGFSVLTAPIAAIDRRSLSQAWYSALHLARNAPRTPEGPEKALTPEACGGSPKAPHPLDAKTPMPSRMKSRACVAGERREQRAPEISGDRRAARSILARRIERAFLYPARKIRRSMFSIDAGGGRVQISLQRDPHGLRLIAVCSHAKRADVARALQEARFALAARGIACDAIVSEAACAD